MQKESVKTIYRQKRWFHLKGIISQAVPFRGLCSEMSDWTAANPQAVTVVSVPFRGLCSEIEDMAYEYVMSLGVSVPFRGLCSEI